MSHFFSLLFPSTLYPLSHQHSRLLFILLFLCMGVSCHTFTSRFVAPYLCVFFQTQLGTVVICHTYVYLLMILQYENFMLITLLSYYHGFLLNFYQKLFLFLHMIKCYLSHICYCKEFWFIFYNVIQSLHSFDTVYFFTNSPLYFICCAVKIFVSYMSELTSRVLFIWSLYRGELAHYNGWVISHFLYVLEEFI